MRLSKAWSQLDQIADTAHVSQLLVPGPSAPDAGHEEVGVGGDARESKTAAAIEVTLAAFATPARAASTGDSRPDDPRAGDAISPVAAERETPALAREPSEGGDHDGDSLKLSDSLDDLGMRCFG